ncbi:MAG: carboxymuconolactone decarboxylase family protein [Burkholderiaceae bacterium]
MAALPHWRDSDVYTELERTAIEYGERMTITGETVDDALFERLRAHFNDAQIVELTAGIAMENFRSKFNVPLQVQSQGYCVLPGN